MTRAHEHDPRLDILNTLLTTPHRQLMPLWPVHQELCGRDPRFYVRLAAWYHDRGEVRDHKEMFIISLVLSSFDGHRDVGLALLRQLPPYQVARVVDFITGKKVKRGKTVEDVGLFKSLPRSLRTEVVRYLRERENNAEWFDGGVLTARKAIKRLYALLHVKPGERAQKVLFDDAPPEDSRLFTLKQLARSTSADEQAAAIVAYRIPYKVAASVVREMTPTVVRALVEIMTPMELINSVGALQKRGALADPDVKQLVESKLAQARGDNRVSAFKAEKAVEATGVSEEIAQSLREVTDARIKARGRISRSTAMLLDRSGSMTIALEVGKRLGAMISAVADAPLFAHVFNTSALMLAPQGPDLAHWNETLEGIDAGGGTSIGAAIEALMNAKQYVEQIVFVTDEDENTAPMFADAYARYARAMKVAPSVIILRVGQSTTKIEKACKNAGIPVSVFRFEGDYYALPNVLPLLSQPSQMDLLMEIVEYPLPTRTT
jgi:hypothetical protein